MSRLRFHVANSLTGRLVGRLRPSEWSLTDPLTGAAEATFRVPLTANLLETQQLAAVAVPHVRQVVIEDEQNRFWFGGPITADPERDGNTIVITCADWREWFYHAPIRPDLTTEARQDYIHVATPVEQCQAIADLAGIGLDTVGAPRMVVDSPPDSEVTREVTHRMFKMTGEAIDNLSRREGGPDWWTYMTRDPADERSVVAHVAVGWPERSQAVTPLGLRHKSSLSLRAQQGEGGNILSATWPRGVPPPSRVFGVGPTPPPAEEWAVAEDPGLAEGERLAWDEVWQLPDGVNTPTTSFEAALARLDAHTEALGVLEVTIDPAATQLGEWGPGDRTRVVVEDGWRDVRLSDRRILSRTIEGRGPHVTSVAASINLSINERDIDEPELEEELVEEPEEE